MSRVPIYRVIQVRSGEYYLPQGTATTPNLNRAAYYNTFEAAQKRARALPICHFWTIKKGVIADDPKPIKKD